jgi:HK97 family phage major capsid protein
MKQDRKYTGILWVLSLIALVAVAFFAFGSESSAFAGGAALASLPFFPIRILMDKDPEGGGGGALSQEQFQRTALGALEKVKGSQDELLKDVSRLDKETKSTLEELTKIKNGFEGYDHQVKALDLAIKKLNLQLTLEQRMAAGGTAMSFGQRLIRDKDKAKQAFGAICRLIGAPELATKALGEDSSPGSTLINDDLHAEVYDSLLRFGAWGTLGVRPIGTKNTKIPVKTARPVANFILTEAGAISDDTAKAGTTVTLEAEVVAVLLNVSLQLLEDGEIDVAADVLDDFIEAVNLRCDFAAFAGNGTADATNGGVTGLFSFATAATAAATRTTIALTKYEDWLRCLTTVDAAVLQRASRWWMHPSLMAAAIGVSDSNGRPIFQTALEAPAGGILNLFGYPVTMVGAAPSTNAASARVAVFGDPRAYAVGMRKQFTFEASDQARWTTLERSFRGHTRFDAVGARASALAAMVLPGA